MNILVCYDVNTLTAAGRKRLRRVARCCQDYGQRVQFSVFECTVNEMRLERLRRRLLKEIDDKEDSLRIYFLGPKREGVVESHGRDTYVDFTAPLVL
jgi:CRISPR-associated protein Cas2